MASFSFQRTLILAGAFLLLNLSCQHPPRTGMDWSHLRADPAHCDRIESALDFNDRIDTLNKLAEAFQRGCYKTFVRYGTRAQTQYRHKTFSVFKETSNIFLRDGTLTDYVLESYERGYLTFLLSAGYYHLDHPEASQVELRRLDHEILTPLYNYGEDPINILFSAVMWEKLGRTDESRVDWKRLQRQEGIDESIRSFAVTRIKQIDAAETLDRNWKIYAVGRFPEIEWKFEFIGSDNGFYSVTPQQPFVPGCASPTGLRLSTRSWFQKIAMRHNNGYHPLLSAQSWLRIPMGVIYGITTFASGAGIAIGGCVLDAYAGGDGSLCRVSIEGGVALVSQAPKVTQFTLQPDLRHWENIPSSFVFTTLDGQQEKCLPKTPYGYRVIMD